MSIHPGPKQFGHLRVKSVCDECGIARVKGNHEKCSKRRQVRTASLAATYRRPERNEGPVLNPSQRQSAETLKRFNALASGPSHD